MAAAVLSIEGLALFAHLGWMRDVTKLDWLKSRGEVCHGVCVPGACGRHRDAARVASLRTPGLVVAVVFFCLCKVCYNDFESGCSERNA